MRIIVCVSLALFASACAHQNDIPVDAKRDAACMFQVLKVVPGVSDANVGTFTYAGATWPYLEYRAAERSRWEQPTRFAVHQAPDGKMRYPDGGIVFMGMLPGAMPIDLHVTDVVVQKWKTQCKVDVVVKLD